MIVISIPLVCILFCMIALVSFQRQRNDLNDWILRAFHAGSSIQAVITLLVDAESGTRGFLLTHDATYLEAYYKLERELPRRLARLKASVGDSASQLKRVESITALSQQRMSLLQSIIAAGGSDDFKDRFTHDRSLMNAIKREFVEMRAKESALWITRTAAETILRNRLSIAMYAAALFSLLAGTLASALFVTGIVERSQLLRLNAERLVCGEPLLCLPQGADEIGQLGAVLAESSELLRRREGELRELNQELELRVKERTAQLAQEAAERGRSEDQLRHAQKMDAVGRLAGGIAHDFNNILTIITGYGQLLCGRLRADAWAHERLERILRAADHAASLTRQLLAFSRRQVIQPEVVDLNSTVSRVHELLGRLIGEHIELQLLADAKLDPVRVDEGQIEQVMINLAVNARDAMPTGGKLTIETHNVELDEAYCQAHLNCAPGRYVMLAVSDSGHGMSAEVQEHIFEPFFTTKEVGQGTGLGLSIVYGIVKQCGGTIWVYSQVGIGTTFKIYLPAAAGTLDVITARASVVDGSDGGTILLVEDEPALRQMTHEILVAAGYIVLEADGPDAACRLCQERSAPIDLLLTDVIMPKMNGRELANELQAKYGVTKVLFMSGYTDDVIFQHGVLDTGVDFLEKPFTPDALCLKIRTVISREEPQACLSSR